MDNHSCRLLRRAESPLGLFVSREVRPIAGDSGFPSYLRLVSRRHSDHLGSCIMDRPGGQEGWGQWTRQDGHPLDRESLAHWGDGLDDNSVCLRVRFVRTPYHWAGGFPPKCVSGLSSGGPGRRCRDWGGGSLGLAARRPAIVLVRRRGKTGWLPAEDLPTKRPWGPETSLSCSCILGLWTWATLEATREESIGTTTDHSGNGSWIESSRLDPVSIPKPMLIPYAATDSRLFWTSTKETRRMNLDGPRGIPCDTGVGNPTESKRAFSLLRWRRWRQSRAGYRTFWRRRATFCTCIVEPDAAAHRQLWRHISFAAADPSPRRKGSSNGIANAFGRGRIGRTARTLRPLPRTVRSPWAVLETGDHRIDVRPCAQVPGSPVNH